MVVTDRRLARGRTHGEIATLALRGGATAIQLRDKEAEDADLLAWAGEVDGLARRAGAISLVNDRLDVARLAGAAGCHLGPEDLPLADARRLWPRPALIGFSAGTPAEARAAEEEGADYLGVGPVYSTSTKGDAGAALGLSGLREVIEATSLPVIAIGGIDATRAGGCVAAGACGVAVIAAVVGAASVAPAARAVRRAVDAALKDGGVA
jgi:thiamine-phosphate diphosphorylase